MKKVLFIINGMTKSNWKVGISGGDIRLFEIMKNMDQVEKHILTTTNWLSAMEKLGISCNEKTVINYEVNPWAFSNLWISILSFFKSYRKIKLEKDDIIYSSCEHLYDVLPAMKMFIIGLRIILGKTKEEILHFCQDICIGSIELFLDF